MLAQFHNLYPNGSIISELIEIFQGKYIVRVSVQLEGITRSTGMSGAETVEAAEDQARNRALTVLGIKNTPEEVTKSTSPPVAPAAIQPILNESKPTPSVSNIQTPSLLTERTDTKIVTPEIFPHQEPEYQPSSGVSPSNVTPFTPRSYTPYEDVDVQSAVSKKKRHNEPINLSDVIAQTDVEIERLGWTPEQGKDYLVKTYGKRGRSLLSEEELRNFLTYLKSQPDPIAGF
ncbi:hypothetical protein FJR38_06930 [Anabaena sp. UHCC 0253]|uniref:hypothetical protein n=1 Tax=Anabaena sp. UHCC 0253 TaxID=2590019 RepID=UPI001446311C|nr:hypothetical protein [Anabaena sp. UHCC 0253]MTJ52417.1 hypothetical protein [Anabaena sp. UHCC 0253]